MKAGRHLLVTGFGPFPGVPVNPSGALARQVGALCRHGLGGMPVKVLVLTTAYEAIPRMLDPALAERPAAVLMIGVAARSRRLRVEVRACNRASRLFPDATGEMATRLVLEVGGPMQRRSTAAARAMAQLRRRGVPVVRSQDAGRYLCNAAYFRALREPCPVLFLHIPPRVDPCRPRRTGAVKRRKPSSTLAHAAVAAARVLLLAARAGP